MDARNRDLRGWFTRIASGQVQLPRFQRFEAWGPREIADLLQTVVDELPAGAALVLEVGDASPFHHRALAGAPDPTERMNELLLDGQQRLTALWRALRDDYEDRQYFVDIREIDRDEDGKRDFEVLPQSRWRRETERHGEVRYPVWCDEPARVLERGLIPVRLLRPDNEDEYMAWLDQAVPDGDRDRILELQRIVLSLRARMATFNLPFLSLPRESSEATILNVFERLNTRSVPLSAFDIIVARVEGETGESLHDLVAALEGQVPALGDYMEPADLILPATAILQGKRPTRRQLVFLDFQQMIEDWPMIVKGAERLVPFLREEKIFDSTRLPTETVLPPLLVLWAMAPESPDELGAVRALLRAYLWRAALTTRYEFSAATAADQDFRALAESIQTGRMEQSAPIFEEPLPEVEELLAAGWPKRRERLARAILAISFRRGALDIADGAPISIENIRQREYHHLYPVAHLKREGVSERAASVALNCALITWRTNRRIAAAPPVDYLRDRVDVAALGEDEVRQRLASHVVDYDALAAGDFDAFLRQRAEEMAEAARVLASGGVWP